MESVAWANIAETLRFKNVGWTRVLSVLILREQGFEEMQQKQTCFVAQEKMTEEQTGPLQMTL